METSPVWSKSLRYSTKTWHVLPTQPTPGVAALLVRLVALSQWSFQQRRFLHRSGRGPTIYGKFGEVIAIHVIFVYFAWLSSNKPNGPMVFKFIGFRACKGTPTVACFGMTLEFPGGNPRNQNVSIADSFRGSTLLNWHPPTSAESGVGQFLVMLRQVLAEPWLVKWNNQGTNTTQKNENLYRSRLFSAPHVAEGLRCLVPCTSGIKPVWLEISSHHHVLVFYPTLSTSWLGNVEPYKTHNYHTYEILRP